MSHTKKGEWRKSFLSFVLSKRKDEFFHFHHDTLENYDCKNLFNTKKPTKTEIKTRLRLFRPVKRKGKANKEAFANARLIAAATFGYKLADAILCQERDGLDRTEFISKTAKEFMAIAKEEKE